MEYTSYKSIDKRKYFHKGRKPVILFVVNNKACSGVMTNYWRNGFTMTAEAHVELERDDIIPKIYYEIGGKEYSLENMRVLHSYWDETAELALIDVYAPDRETEDSFRHLVDSIMGRPDPVVARHLDESKIPKFSGKDHYTAWATQTRLLWARGISGSDLDNISQAIFNPETLAGNIENYIGAVQIPIGLAGPVLVRGVYVDGYVPVPIGTTEGALVSSISRGAHVCNLAGGIEARVISQRMVRAPVFFCEDMYGAMNLEKWIINHMERIKEKAESVSSVAQVKQILPLVFGDTLHLRIYYYTGDAAGQNMTTACTWVACEWIAKQIRDYPSIKFIKYNIEGNMSGDKKANYQNFINGRGVSVVASCWIPGIILEKFLRVTVDDFIKGWQTAEVGSLQIGMMGSNINFANVIAGIFTASGQDIASVHESSVGIFKAIKKDDGIQFTAHLPSLVIGTVGGGTKLPTQRDCLELMGCYGTGKSFRLAEIIAATCLALDISTGSAIASNEFVSAHERLGRNRPTKRIAKADIDVKFFNTVMASGTTGLQMLSFEENSMITDSGIVSNLAKEKSTKFQGLFRYRATVSNGGTSVRNMVLKIKSADTEIIDIGAGLAKLSGEDRLPGLFEAQQHIFGFENSHIREIECYRHFSPGLMAYTPVIYGTAIDYERELFAVLMEDLSECSHLETVNNAGAWDDEAIGCVIDDLAGMHAVYLNRFDEVPPAVNIITLDEERSQGAVPFLKELTDFNALRFPAIIEPGLSAVYRSYLDGMGAHVRAMRKAPMTVTHNDFNTRNICLRPVGASPRLIAYDWELPCYQNPQHDLVEFLVYALNDGMASADAWAERYRQKLAQQSGVAIDADEFKRIMLLNALDLAVVRFNLYLLAHNIAKFSFFERVYRNLKQFIQARQDLL